MIAAIECPLSWFRSKYVRGFIVNKLLQYVDLVSSTVRQALKVDRVIIHLFDSGNAEVVLDPKDAGVQWAAL